MGLDQYWLTKIPDSSEKSGFRYEEIAYHRKFNALEGFMAKKWAAETSRSAEEFNCEYLTVTPELLNELETAVKEDTLEPTAGFFFGSPEKNEWYRNDVAELGIIIIPRIREHLQDGEEIVYTSWW